MQFDSFDGFDHPETFNVIQYKGKASKSREFVITKYEIRDIASEETIIILSDITKIILGKNTNALLQNKGAKTYPSDDFFSLFNANGFALDCQVMHGERNEMIDAILHNMRTNKKLQHFNWNSIKTQIQNTPKNEVLEISLMQKKSQYPNWNVVRYKAHKHKSMSIQLQSNRLVDVMNNKIIFSLQDIEQIFIGKCTKSLKKNKSAKLKAQSAFFSIILSNNRVLDFEVVDETQRKDLICAVIDGINLLHNQNLIRKVPKKGLAKTKELINFLQGDVTKQLKIEFIRTNAVGSVSPSDSSKESASFEIVQSDSELVVLRESTIHLDQSDIEVYRKSVDKLENKKKLLERKLDQSRSESSDGNHGISRASRQSNGSIGSLRYDSVYESGNGCVAKDAEIAYLRNKMIQMQKEMSANDITDAERELGGLQSDCIDKGDQIYRLKQVIVALKTKLMASMLIKVSGKEELRMQHEADLKRIESLESNLAQDEELADHTTDLQMQHQADLKRINTLKHEREADQYKLNAVEAECNRKGQQIYTLEHEIRSSLGSFSGTDRRCTVAEKLEEENKKLRKQNDGLKKNEERLKSEIKKIMKNRLSRAEKQFRESRSGSIEKEVVVGLNDMLKEKQNVIKELKSEIKTLETKRVAKKDKMMVVATEQQMKIQRLDNEIRQFRTNSFRLDPQNILDRDEIVEDLEAENEEFRRTNERLAREQSKMKDEIQKLLRKNAELIAYWKNVKQIWTTIDTEKIFRLMNQTNHASRRTM